MFDTIRGALLYSYQQKHRMNARDDHGAEPQRFRRYDSMIDRWLSTGRNARAQLCTTARRPPVRLSAHYPCGFIQISSMDACTREPWGTPLHARTGITATTWFP